MVIMWFKKFSYWVGAFGKTSALGKGLVIFPSRELDVVRKFTGPRGFIAGTSKSGKDLEFTAIACPFYDVGSIRFGGKAGSDEGGVVCPKSSVIVGKISKCKHTEALCEGLKLEEFLRLGKFCPQHSAAA